MLVEGKGRSSRKDVHSPLVSSANIRARCQNSTMYRNSQLSVVRKTALREPLLLEHGQGEQPGVAKAYKRLNGDASASRNGKSLSKLNESSISKMPRKGEESSRPDCSSLSAVCRFQKLPPQMRFKSVSTCVNK